MLAQYKVDKIFIKILVVFNVLSCILKIFEIWLNISLFKSKEKLLKGNSVAFSVYMVFLQSSVNISQRAYSVKVIDQLQIFDIYFCLCHN